MLTVRPVPLPAVVHALRNLHRSQLDAGNLAVLPSEIATALDEVSVR